LISFVVVVAVADQELCLSALLGNEDLAGLNWTGLDWTGADGLIDSI